jgi:DNA polymerase-3 subunit beta
LLSLVAAAYLAAIGEKDKGKKAKNEKGLAMKLSIDRAALIKPLGHIQGVVERRNTIPILSNLVIRAEAGQLRLTATDMEMDMVETVSSSVSEEGVITTPAHMLYDIVRKLPEGSEISLTADNTGQAQISAGRSSFRLPTLSVEDFPAISAAEMPVAFQLPAADLKDMIELTRMATSTEESRYYLNGIYLHHSPDRKLRAVATDGHRLALTQMDLPQGAETMPAVIIPRKAYTELFRLMEDYDGDVEVGLSDNRARFSLGQVVMTTKLIDGTFPDYERVVPKDNQRKSVVKVADFSAAVDRVSTISAEKTRTVQLTFSNAGLTISASNAQDQASATETIETNWSDDDMKIGFNARYLLDITNLIEGDEMEFAFAEPSNPTLIRSPMDDASLFVVMPMRV